MIRLAFDILVTFAALVGVGMAINAIAAWVYPDPICERCRRLPASHVRRLRREPKLPLPGDRVHRVGGRR